MPTPIPTATPDIPATAQAQAMAIIAAIPTATPQPTATPMPPPTPDIQATIVANLQAAAMEARPTATPRPTRTPRPTSTPRPRPTPTPIIIREPTVSISEMVKRVRPAIVRIETVAGTGSGVIFKTTGVVGYVITNAHVVGKEARVTVTVRDTERFEGTVLGTDVVRDLAVVSICCGGFHSLLLGNPGALDPGDEVVAMGYPLGLEGRATVTRGIVSAFRYDVALRSDVVQTDTAINPGNSGGPLLSLNGVIMGITTCKIFEADPWRDAEALGFAVSATTVSAEAPRLISAGARVTPTPTIPPTSPGPTPHNPEIEYGPRSGELHHDTLDGQLEYDLFPF